MCARLRSTLSEQEGCVEDVEGVVAIVAFLAFFGGVAYWILFHDGVLERHVDFLRRRLTTGIDLGAREDVVHRGDQVEAVVTVSRPRGLGRLEVGLVCTESYDYWSSSTPGSDSGSSRETAHEVAHEAWQAVEPGVGEHTVRFGVPVDAPFSYKGTCLSFKWELVAVGRRRRRLDAQAAADVTVLP
jgi:hypothetical protein